MNLRFRFAIAAFLLAGTAILLHLLDYEVVLPGKPLHSFPYQLGNLQGSDIPISQEELDILGQGEFLLRDYADPADKNPDVNLFIAYFPSQRAGDTIHSPKHCLQETVGGGATGPGFWSPCRGTSLFRRVAPSSAKTTSENWLSIGIGPMIGRWPAKSRRNTIW